MFLSSLATSGAVCNDLAETPSTILEFCLFLNEITYVVVRNDLIEFPITDLDLELDSFRLALEVPVKFVKVTHNSRSLPCAIFQGGHEECTTNELAGM